MAERKLKRKITHIDADEIERKILIGMIISTEYLRMVGALINIKYFQLEYSKIISEWVLGYYSKYKKAPLEHIEDIYDVEKQYMKEEMSELIKDFLSDLSVEYQKGRKFNAEYLLDQTIEYLDERSLVMLAEKISSFVGAGRIDEAKRELREYKTVTKLTSSWINPFDEDFMKSVYDSHLKPDIDEGLESNPYKLFKMPGKLGDLMGVFERDWLVAYLAPRKRGKTFLLQETGIQAATNGLNVCIISLEMSKNGFGGRLLQRIVAMGNSTLYYYPTFDCAHNQDDSCRKSRRTNSIKLTDENGNVPEFSEELEYRPCVACRGSKSYKVAVWFDVVNRPMISQKRLITQATGFFRTFGDKMRIKVYPAFSANLKQIISDIDTLEYSENFVPDVILIDYADILAPEDRRMDLHTRTDETWKTLKQLADLKHCCVITATQGNRKSSEKKNVVANDTSWDISKNDHIDAQFALSQTPFEKKMGAMRISNTLHRWKEFDESEQATILQNLKLSQVILDSEM